MPDYKYMCNKLESEFLTCQAEYSESCERLGSCLATEYSMMKFSTLFECGPLPPPPPPCPPRVHLKSFPIFTALSLSFIILKANLRTKTGEPCKPAYICFLLVSYFCTFLLPSLLMQGRIEDNTNRSFHKSISRHHQSREG